MGFVNNSATGGAFPASISPAQDQVTLATNYLSFTDGTNDFAQQYLPELYEAEVERYGNRTLSAFLRMVLIKLFGLNKIDYMYLTIM
jgi:hypothetical protein